MRVNNAFDNIVNVVRLDDGMPFIFQNDTKVEKYNAILTIEKKGWILVELRKEIKVDKKVFEIADKLGKEEILCQLSEECAELIQSCLKYCRTTKGLTPKSEEEVRENLFEELSDVLMNIEQIKYLFNKELSDTTVENVIEKWHSYKADRWYRRTFVSQEEN